ncbi:MAG: gamma-glutamylcyclotransferase [Acidiferrobacterales bacterium]|nr:gamma-glutamylcyclotransferase [Acidiferrobacterales bacterium]
MQDREPFPLLTDAERARSLRDTLANVPDGGGVWVFGYGSLMWNPEFTHVDRRMGTVRGYRRRFCVLSARARGTPEKPGLGLGLQREDGECRGLVYQLDDRCLETDLLALWNREMTSGIYQPHWLPVETSRSEIMAIAFIVDCAHVQYAGDLSLDEQANIIHRAAGTYGPSRDYLAKTIHELAALGVSEPGFEALLAQVDARSK